ncbi:MAG: hypothetical protein QXG65_00990 [Thermoplasmata archaeon]
MAASSWAGVGVLGILAFALGIWTPAWAGVPGGGWLSLVTAAVGGILVVVGFTYAWRARPPRPVPVEEMPGVEVYDPAGGGDPRP